MKKNQLLGGLSPAYFLRHYWQKKPLLVRQAFSSFTGFLSKKQLMDLSTQPEVFSRLVSYSNSLWHLREGPFKKNQLTKLKGHWALLVEGLNYQFPQAQALLKAFNFIPHVRLDDLMVSIAPNGGGVGPHFDSYDVFLLQGSGKRLWKVSNQKNRKLLPEAPLRILKHFTATQEWLLEPGDMLYLPPQYAHHGIAVGESITYSVGFRAPSYQELAEEFLIYLQDQAQFPGLYTDPDLISTKNPGQIPTQMLTKVTTKLTKIFNSKKEIEIFLGKYLSTPKCPFISKAPGQPLSRKSFFMKAVRQGICLDLKSKLFFTKKNFFINGTQCIFPTPLHVYFKQLANERELICTKATLRLIGNFLYEWYKAGYVRPKECKK